MSRETTIKAAPAKETTGILLVLLATFSLSTEAIAAKIAYQEGVGVITALSLRYAIAALIFWAILIILKQPFKLSRGQFLSVTALALGGQVTTVLCLFYAFKFIPAAMAILFLYVYPTVVTLLAYFFLKEPLTWRKALALALTLAGCAVILGQPLQGLDPRGIMLSLGAAVLNAIFMVGSTRLISDIPVQVYTSHMTAIVALVFLAAGTVGGTLNLSLNLQAWEAVVFLGVICTVLSMFTLFKGVSIIGASRASIICTLEPVVTAVLGLWLLQESLTAWQVLGGSLVMTGVLLQRRG